MPTADTKLVAEVFVLQEMRGIRTHGLRRIQRNLDWLRDGQMNPTPNRQVLSDSGATVVLDGDHSIGMVGCMDGMRRAMDKAKEFGIGICIIINSNHFLAAAPYCLRAADEDMIGLAFSNTLQSMGYPGAAHRVIGNGPFGFAAPTSAGYPLVFDAALAASYGKLSQWMREGKLIPPYLPAMDRDGNATDNPQAALDGGTPMPIGMHKGAGLVLLIEILTGILGGGAFLSAILPPENRSSKKDAESQCCIAVDIGHFMPPADFRGRMQAFIEDLKSQPRAVECGDIHVPGEHAHLALQKSLSQGILIEPDVEQELREMAAPLHVELPF